MSAYHLAQLNIAWMKASLESAEMADFVANLERINALAEGSPGYVWRLQDEAGDTTAIRPFGDEVWVNMSLWQDVQGTSKNYLRCHRSVKNRLERQPGQMLIYTA